MANTSKNVNTNVTTALVGGRNYGIVNITEDRPGVGGFVRRLNPACTRRFSCGLFSISGGRG